MTHADNATVALGRSRDTGVGVAPFPRISTELPPSRRVVLRVWGFDSQEARTAEAVARAKTRERRLEVTEVITTTGAPCLIPRRDPIAVVQGADFDQAWAAYPLGCAPVL